MFGQVKLVSRVSFNSQTGNHDLELECDDFSPSDHVINLGLTDIGISALSLLSQDKSFSSSTVYESSAELIYSMFQGFKFKDALSDKLRHSIAYLESSLSMRKTRENLHFEVRDGKTYSVLELNFEQQNS